MNKKISKLIFIAAILISMTVFCSYSKNNIIKVNGHIRVYGNEPFTYIGIKTDNNKEYALTATDDVLKELRIAQGKTIEIIGLLIQNNDDNSDYKMLKDGRIEVTEWSVLK